MTLRHLFSFYYGVLKHLSANTERFLIRSSWIIDLSVWCGVHCRFRTKSNANKTNPPREQCQREYRWKDGLMLYIVVEWLLFLIRHPAPVRFHQHTCSQVSKHAHVIHSNSMLSILPRKFDVHQEKSSIYMARKSYHFECRKLECQRSDIEMPLENLLNSARSLNFHLSTLPWQTFNF